MDQDMVTRLLENTVCGQYAVPGLSLTGRGPCTKHRLPEVHTKLKPTSHYRDLQKESVLA